MDKFTYLFVLGLSFNLNTGFSFNFRFPSLVEKTLNIERCNDYWVSFDHKGFKRDLQSQVFGQPFLSNTLIPSLVNHFEDQKPAKPLAISFHGSSGTGKTYVSQIIANNLFRKGVSSYFFKFYTLKDYVSLTRKELIDEIMEHGRKCPQVLFVFDEIEKAENGAFDIIKPFIDYYHIVGDVDFRKSVFLFISNIATGEVNALTRTLWKSGLKREEFKLSYFRKELEDVSYKADGGFKGSYLIKNYLIDVYLPFLPLLKEHVEQCIKVKKPDISKEDIRDIMDQLEFVPFESPIFSLTGCKAIKSKIIQVNKKDDRLLTYDEL